VHRREEVMTQLSNQVALSLELERDSTEDGSLDVIAGFLRNEIDLKCIHEEVLPNHLIAQEADTKYSIIDQYHVFSAMMKVFQETFFVDADVFIETRRRLKYYLSPNGIPNQYYWDLSPLERWTELANYVRKLKRYFGQIRDDLKQLPDVNVWFRPDWPSSLQLREQRPRKLYGEIVSHFNRPIVWSVLSILMQTIFVASVALSFSADLGIDSDDRVTLIADFETSATVARWVVWACSGLFLVFAMIRAWHYHKQVSKLLEYEKLSYNESEESEKRENRRSKHPRLSEAADSETPAAAVAGSGRGLSASESESEYDSQD
jgi:hypothetical protein